MSPLPRDYRNGSIISSALMGFGLLPILAASLRPTAPFALFSVLVTSLIVPTAEGDGEEDGREEGLDLGSRHGE
jgi:hypothetical protein